MKRVINFNTSDNFIKQLALFVDENFIKAKADLSRLAFVFGGQRPALFLKKELSRIVGESFVSPKFFAMDEFVEYSLKKDKLFTNSASLDNCHIIYKLVQGQAPEILKKRETFAQFLGWAQEILGFIDQLDLEDVDSSSLRNIELNASIGYDVPESINKLLGSLSGIRESFHEALLKNKTYSRGMKYLLASKALPERSWQEFDCVIFCGFFYLHKTEEKMIKHLYEDDKAILVFQGNENEWPVLGRVARNLGIELEAQGVPVKKHNLSLHAGFDVHSQACLAREILKKQGDFENTVIVLPQADNAIPLLVEVAPLIQDFNISLGYPLSRSSAFSLFEAIFKAQETKKGLNYYSRDYLRVLAHPLVKNMNFSNPSSVTRIMTHKIEEVLKGEHSLELSGSSFVQLCDIEEEKEIYSLGRDVLRKLHLFMFKMWEDIANFGMFAHALEKFLNLFSEDSFLKIHPLDFKMMERLFSVSDEVMNVSFKDEVFNPSEIYKIFISRIAKEMVSFSGTPLKGLQILGLLETRSLNFDNVIIMDVNESVLPKLKIHEPLVPRDVMLSLGINRLEKEEEIQRYQFRRLIESAKNIHLIYQETESKERSRFIEELVWDKEKEAHAVNVVPVERVGFNVMVSNRDIEIQKNLKVLDFLRSYRYSASTLNVYLNCPLRFYYQVVLGLKEKEGLTSEPEAKDIGNFVHDLLEETFLSMVGKNVKIDGKFQKYFFETFESKFKAEFQKKMKSDAFLVKKVLEYRLEKFLEHEKTRRVKEILGLEKLWEEPAIFNGIAFDFKCRLDRLDRLSDESLLIIDYKTGGMDIMPKHWEKVLLQDFSRESIKKYIKSFQLPLYYHFVKCSYPDLDVNAGLYNLRDAGKTTLKTLFSEHDSKESRVASMEIFMKSIGKILSEIVCPSVSFKPDRSEERYCSFCPFSGLCS